MFKKIIMGFAVMGLGAIAAVVCAEDISQEKEELSLVCMQPLTHKYVSLNKSFSIGQTYVPELSQLTKISIFIKGPERAEYKGTVTLSIRKTWKDAAIYSSSLQTEKISRDGEWVDFCFNESPQVDAGCQYLIHLSSDMPQEADCKVAIATDYFYDLYPQGTAQCVWKNEDARILKNTDIAFKVYALKTPEPEKRSTQKQEQKKIFMNIDYSDNFNQDFTGVNCFGNGDGVAPQKEIFDSLKKIKENGFDGVFWRVSFLGRVMYHSRIRDVFSYKDANTKSLIKMEEAIQKCDPLREAVKACKALDLKIFVWVLLNDDGSKQKGFFSSFLEKNPDYQWVSRDGKQYLDGVPCFAYPEVRKYFLSQMKELMEYNVDGIYMSTRSHSSAFGRETLMKYGFNKPVIEAFHEKYGKDISKGFSTEEDGDKFIELNGDLMNDFYRDVKKLRDEQFPSVKLVADLSFLPQNWPLLVKENLIDSLLVESASGSTGILPSGNDYRDIPDFYLNAVKKINGSTDVLMWMQIVNYKQQTYHSKEIFYKDVLGLMKSKCQGAAFHEHANFIKYPEEFWPYLMKAWQWPSPSDEKLKNVEKPFKRSL